MYAENMEMVVVDALKTAMKSKASEPTVAEKTKRELVQTLRELSQEIYDLVFDLSAENLMISILEREIESLMTGDIKESRERVIRLRSEVRGLSQKVKAVEPAVKKAYMAAFSRTKRELDRLEKAYGQMLNQTGVSAKQRELQEKYESRRRMVKALNEKNDMKKRVRTILESPVLLEQAAEMAGVVGNA